LSEMSGIHASQPALLVPVHAIYVCCAVMSTFASPPKDTADRVTIVSKRPPRRLLDIPSPMDDAALIGLFNFLVEVALSLSGQQMATRYSTRTSRH
jgi:hypothetical protein